MDLDQIKEYLEFISFYSSFVTYNTFNDDNPSSLIKRIKSTINHICPSLELLIDDKLEITDQIIEKSLICLTFDSLKISQTINKDATVSEILAYSEMFNNNGGINY